MSLFTGDVTLLYNLYYINIILYYLYINCYTLQTATFAFHKVVWRQYSGEVSKFTIF